MYYKVQPSKKKSKNLFLADAVSEFLELLLKHPSL